jgi:hypothetical protein
VVASRDLTQKQPRFAVAFKQLSRLLGTFDSQKKDRAFEFQPERPLDKLVEQSDEFFGARDKKVRSDMPTCS